MKTFLLVVNLAFALQLSAPDKLMFDTAKVDGNTKLIGRYPQYDKQKAFRQFNFFIGDPATIKQVMSTLTLGKEEIEKIVPAGSYTLFYVLDQRNLKDQNNFIMTIQGSKKLFETLNVGNLKKENWKPVVEEGMFFYRTK